MTATTETTKTMTIDGAGVSGDALHEFLSDVPGYALVQMRPAGGQMDPARTTITARWSPRKREPFGRYAPGVPVPKLPTGDAPMHA